VELFSVATVYSGTFGRIAPDAQPPIHPKARFGWTAISAGRGNLGLCGRYDSLFTRKYNDQAGGAQIAKLTPVLQ
jgi:hypothetical protein